MGGSITNTVPPDVAVLTNTTAVSSASVDTVSAQVFSTKVPDEMSADLLNVPPDVTGTVSPKVSQESSTVTTSSTVSNDPTVDTDAVSLHVSTADTTAVYKEDTSTTSSIVFSKVPANEAAGVTLSEVHTSVGATNKEDIVKATSVFSQVHASTTTVVFTEVPDSTSTVLSIAPADTGGTSCSKVPDADIILKVQSTDVNGSAVPPNTTSQHAVTVSAKALTKSAVSTRVLTNEVNSSKVLTESAASPQVHTAEVFPTQVNASLLTCYKSPLMEQVFTSKVSTAAADSSKVPTNGTRISTA